MSVEFLNQETKTYFKGENYLYRIITLDRFIEMMASKLTFVSPSKWSDPYEKAFLEATYKVDQDEYSHPLRPGDGYVLYAQCWTGSAQTEAMWRGFAPNSDGVMIKIHVEKIEEVLRSISDKGTYNFYIGQVRYENSEQLYQMKSKQDIWDAIRKGEVNSKTLDLLFKKRQAFNFENEFRILAIKRNRSSKNRTPYVKFNVPDLITKIEYVKFDPRMGEELFKFVKTSIKNTYPSLNVHKSRLYSNPLRILTFNGTMPQEVDDELVFM